jgi:dTDP-4-amino-4,6-dideoxygalactose transaminase
VDIGSSWLPSELLAAFLLAQLEGREAIQAKRRSVWERYKLGLAQWADENGVGMPTIPVHCQQPHHMFYVLLPSLESRTRFLATLREQGFRGAFHYQPLHSSPMGRSLGGRPGQCPVAELAGDRLVRLPFYNDLAPADQDMVIEAVSKFVP